jgi:hypothetical protein
MAQRYPGLVVPALLTAALLGSGPARSARPTQDGTASAVASAGGRSTAPAPAPAVLTRLGVDAERADALFSRAGSGGVPITDVLRAALMLRTQSQGTVALVLFAFRIRDGRIASRFVSKPFKVEPGSTLLLGSRSGVLPPESFYEGDETASSGDGRLAATAAPTLRVGPEDLRLATKAAPTLRGTQNPLEYIKDGVWPDVPTDPKTRSSVYLIAAPSDRTLLAESAGYPLLALLGS